MSRPATSSRRRGALSSPGPAYRDITASRKVRSAGTWCAPVSGFRGLAAVLVVVGHSFLSARNYPFTSVIHIIALIVPTFFVISGYALYRPFLLADVEGTPMPSARAFWWKRFLRVYPLYATALTLYLIALPGVRPAGGRILDYVKLFGFLQVYDANLSRFSGIPAAWFLCDEVAFYLFLPLIAVTARALVRRGRPSPSWQDRLQSHVKVAIAMIVVGTIARNSLILLHVSTATALPVSNLDYYGFGILLAAASVAERGGVRLPGPVEWLRRRPQVAGAALVVGFVAMLFVAHHPDYFTPNEDLGRYALYTIMVVPLMVVMVLGDQRKGFNQWLADRRWQPLAVLSLHVYLWHQLALGGFDRYVTAIADVRYGPRFTTGAILMVGAVIATVAWSWLLRPVLDRPYLLWASRPPGGAKPPDRRRRRRTTGPRSNRSPTRTSRRRIAAGRRP